ncbi:hypothetical protein [Shewanella fodinae]|uniref:Uncharacterized protein n=1 Tax=Shewanella fodinae TaxID=552357 RepID=A0A4R2F280_9GAMM|nr:hypothetical protein [Shewanella fodinae]TCN79364.1 hypothetical protein EDC91_13537 [Shewanella fodinae]
MNQILLAVIATALLILLLKWWLDHRIKQYLQQQLPQQWQDISQARGGVVAAIHLSLREGSLSQRHDPVLARYQQQTKWLKIAAVSLLVATLLLGFYLQ